MFSADSIAKDFYQNYVAQYYNLWTVRLNHHHVDFSPADSNQSLIATVSLGSGFFPTLPVDVQRFIDKQVRSPFSVFYVVSPRLLSSVFEELYYYATNPERSEVGPESIARAADIQALARTICVRTRKLTVERDEAQSSMVVKREAPPKALFDFINDVTVNGNGW